MDKNKEVYFDLSIIIPVYNTSFIDFERCIDSIKGIDSIKFEIIVVDDGSTEANSREYLQFIQDARNINYYKIENHGVSYARNYGIKKALGKYIMFVDSDDEIISESIEKCIFKGEYDLIIYNTLTIKGENSFVNKIFEKESGILPNEYVIEEHIIKGSLNGPWAKLYKKDFLKANNLLFDINMIQGEDSFFNLLVLNSNPAVYYTDKVMYKYYFMPVNTQKRWLEKFESALYGIDENYKKRTIIIQSFPKSKREVLLQKYNKTFIRNYLHIYYLIMNKRETRKLAVMSDNLSHLGVNIKYLDIKDKLIFYLMVNKKEYILKLLYKLKKNLKG